MSCRDGELARLDDLERQFEDRLLSALREVRDGHDSLFFLAPGLHQIDGLRGKEPARTVQLADMAATILVRRQRLGEPADCLAAKFLAHCAAANDQADAHRLGARRRAALFLEQIGRD